MEIGELPLPSETPKLVPGTVVGRCRIIRLIATGGQGCIYLARHDVLDRDVAVKVLPPSLAQDEEFRRRFVREARAAAKLEHPNIVQVYDAVSEDGLHYIVMQYVDGKDLQTILEKKGTASVSDALSIAKRVAVALSAAHKAGVIHRDIKPSNIMITRQGKVMITDFGLARDLSASMSGTITQGGFVMGTPDYLSPEQAMGERTDARSDVYSLGATLYRILAGRPPYPDGNPMTVLMKHVRENEKPEPIHALNPNVTEALEALVGRMMEKSAGKRFQSMDEVAQAIDLVKGPRAGRTTVIDSEAVQAGVHRRMWVNMAIGVGIGIAAVMLLIVLLRPDPADRALRVAQAEEARAQTNSRYLEGAIERYREVTKDFPGTEQAQIAGERLRSLEERLARLKVEERLVEIERAYPGRRYDACAGELREIIGGRPGLAANAREVWAKLARVEILSRAGKMVEFVKARDYDRVTDMLDPADVRRQSADRLRATFRLILGRVTREESELDVKPHGERLTVGLEDDRAELPVTVSFRRGEERVTHEGTWRWKAVDDSWYLDLRE